MNYLVTDVCTDTAVTPNAVHVELWPVSGGSALQIITTDLGYASQFRKGKIVKLSIDPVL